MNRMRSQRGAVAIEAALLTPLLCLLVFGIIEMSLYLRDAVSVSSSVHVGARIASAQPGAGPGTCPSAADYPPPKTPPPCVTTNVPAFAQNAADAIQRAGTAMPKDSINYIFVYKANNKGYPGTLTAMPTTMNGCAAVTDCVVFKWVDATNRFKYWSGTWQSKDVNACIQTKNTDGSITYADAVGIYMNATHEFITPIFGHFGTLGDKAVMTFEPLSATQCKANTHP
jgi:TadE-like protein